MSSAVRGFINMYAWAKLGRPNLGGPRSCELFRPKLCPPPTPSHRAMGTRLPAAFRPSYWLTERVAQAGGPGGPQVPRAHAALRRDVHGRRPRGPQLRQGEEAHPLDLHRLPRPHAPEGHGPRLGGGPAGVRGRHSDRHRGVCRQGTERLRRAARRALLPADDWCANPSPPG